MIETFKFVNNAAAEFDFYATKVSLQKCDPEVNVRSEDLNKMQFNGNWPTFTYLGALLLHCEGQLLGDDSADVNSIRKSLLDKLFPTPGTAPTTQKLGYIEMQMTGWTEAARNDCTIDGWPSLPMVGGYSAIIEWQITFKFWRPWFIGVSSSNPYLL